MSSHVNCIEKNGEMNIIEIVIDFLITIIIVIK